MFALLSLLFSILSFYQRFSNLRRSFPSFYSISFSFFFFLFFLNLFCCFAATWKVVVVNKWKWRSFPKSSGSGYAHLRETLQNKDKLFYQRLRGKKKKLVFTKKFFQVRLLRQRPASPASTLTIIVDLTGQRATEKQEVEHDLETKTLLEGSSLQLLPTKIYFYVSFASFFFFQRNVFFLFAFPPPPLLLTHR